MAWQTSVVLIGLAAAGYVGATGVAQMGLYDASLWTALLVYVFGLSYGANRLQLWLARPPVSPLKSPFLGVVAFAPMFLAWFPSSSWTMEMGRVHGYTNVPSPFWMMALMLWGLIAPGGAVVQGLRRLARR